MAANNVPPTTLITTKLLYNGSIRRFKVYLKDCGANTLPGKVSFLTFELSERYRADVAYN